MPNPLRTPAHLADLLAEVYAAACAGQPPLGAVATYIPELATVDPERFGVYLRTTDGREAGFGDAERPFSIQSIAKVLALTLAYRDLGEALWRRVGVEPSGGAFNSLIQLERDAGIPRNPMLNAGALVVADVLLSLYPDPKRTLRDFVRAAAGNPALDFDAAVARSELATGHRNEAVVQFMRSFGNVVYPLADVMDLYCHLCALELSCADLARAFDFLAGRGVSSVAGARLVSKRCAQRINAVMQMCGFYDEAGDFAYRVGLPGKSGVGGGIVAVHPNQYTIAVYSPRLNAKGNSVLGTRFLEEWTTVVGETIF